MQETAQGRKTMAISVGVHCRKIWPARDSHIDQTLAIIRCTAVFLAAMEGRLEIVRGLIEFLHADGEARENGGRTSVYVAASGK